MFPRTIPTLIIFLPISILLFHQTTATDTTPSSPVLYEIYPFIRVYNNGTVQRFIGLDKVPPSLDPATGVRSKDIIFAPNLNLSARLYLPKNPSPARKLPLLIYYHGGGFFIESASSPTYHNHLNSLVSKANVVAVSVNYRLAPEHPLPTAYGDSWLALKWALSCSDQWLKKYADFRRVYLGGDSAGANIANQMAIRVGLLNPGRVTLRGMFMNCPFFLGKSDVGNESAFRGGVAYVQKLWLYAYPNSSNGLDDPLVNPGTDPELNRVGCKRVLVYVAGNDVLRFRGWYYKEALERSGWGGVVKVVDVQGENHVFNLQKPNSTKARAMLSGLAYFLNH